MITAAAAYDYHPSGAYNETLATLADGRICTVDLQYACVLPRGPHGAGCSQITKMGGRCDCGLLDGIDVEALVADARARGKTGLRPQPKAASAAPVRPEWRSPRGLSLNEEMDREDSDY